MTKRSAPSAAAPGATIVGLLVVLSVTGTFPFTSSTMSGFVFSPLALNISKCCLLNSGIWILLRARQVDLQVILSGKWSPREIRPQSSRAKLITRRWSHDQEIVVTEERIVAKLKSAKAVMDSLGDGVKSAIGLGTVLAGFGKIALTLFGV
jgi:hypothetical protein